MIKINGQPISVTRFPNGESLIKDDFSQNSLRERVEVALKFESDADLLHLMMIKHQLDQRGIKAKLRLPYVPYSRMDRTEGVNVFTLKSVCSLINSLNFETVHILEPHSDVCVALLDRVVPYEYTINTLLNGIVSHEIELDLKGNDYLVFPDGGAEKRYSKQVGDVNVLTAIKHRDFKTGYIKSLEVIGEAKEGFNAIIVDDLCCKGGTFMLTANKLKEMGANKIYLVVTHCESSIFEGDVLKKDSPIDRVFTTNTLLSDLYLGLGKDQFEWCFGKSVNRDKLSIVEVI